MSHVHTPCGFPKCQGMKPPSSSSLPIKLWPLEGCTLEHWELPIASLCSRRGRRDLWYTSSLSWCSTSSHVLRHGCYWGGINTNLKAVKNCHTSQKFCQFRLLCKTPVFTNRLLNNVLLHAMQKTTNQGCANPIHLQDLILSKTITFLVCLVRRIYWAALLVSLMFDFKSKRSPHH